jgi:hypothetical protein
MTNPTHETEEHKAERATARILEAAAKLGAGEGKAAGTFWGSRRILAQDIRNASVYGRGWHLLTASNARGNEMARFAMVQCLQASFVDAYVAGAEAKGMTNKAAKASAASAWSSMKNVHAKNIEAEELEREEALAKQARIDAGEDMAAVEAEAAAERGAKKRADVVANILKSASTDMVSAMVLRAERDAMELDTDKRLDNVIALLTDIVWELGGDEATKAATESARKKAKATAPIK